MFFSSQFEPKGKTALIVGSSQGLGAEIALKLYEQECSVILVARTASKLKAQVERIVSTVGKKDNTEIYYISSDVSNYKAAQDMWDEVFHKRGQDPDFIFCCAGSAVPKLFIDITEKDINDGIDINFKTAYNVCHTAYKTISKVHSNKESHEYKKRTIVLFSSVISVFPFIGYGQYGPMKAALLNFSIILRQELKPFNFRVATVIAGNFQSEGYDVEQQTKPEITKVIEGPSHAMPASECAQIILKNLNRGVDTIYTDLIGWFVGCFYLGLAPRNWYIVQIFVSLLLLIIGPIVGWSMDRDIKKYYQQHKLSATVTEQAENSDLTTTSTKKS
ncbi:3-ketosphinganine reductase [Suhomyces tanzawaensis NRRL Y-17324]|uniref:3-ketodihydrosphingosine reductase TSC10 n=1 Tax=Suhomyces tanzawaensis NRRL Y-17324 TaxID=984487 RepID=A0A1E4SLH1_9ASCO|nr:3-ketosphinganine reductase [Suhomyces tanzawaensis NRRL Y-17324]ODV80247.1 3-ketosphinganine reductase [Suhomyces tanzawaensis NRRL Y-17324]